jgi:hypothetical protein
MLLCESGADRPAHRCGASEGLIDALCPNLRRPRHGQALWPAAPVGLEIRFSPPLSCVDAARWPCLLPQLRRAAPRPLAAVPPAHVGSHRAAAAHRAGRGVDRRRELWGGRRARARRPAAGACPSRSASRRRATAAGCARARSHTRDGSRRARRRRASACGPWTAETTATVAGRGVRSLSCDVIFLFGLPFFLIHRHHEGARSPQPAGGVRPGWYLQAGICRLVSLSARPPHLHSIPYHDTSF